MASIKKSAELQRIDLGVCVPSTGTWMQQFGKSLALAFADWMNWRPEPDLRVASKMVQLLTVRSSMLVQSRHSLVRSAMKAGCSHILFLDSDMAFPKDLFRRMWERDKDILAANCVTRTFPCKPVSHDYKGNVIDSRGRRGLEAVRQAGLAVCMIKREVFEKIQPPFFSMEWVPDMGAYAGEDVYFTQVVQEAGFKVLVDHDISKEIYHCGYYTYGHDDIDREADDTKDKGSEEAFALGELRKQRKFNLG